MDTHDRDAEIDEDDGEEALETGWRASLHRIVDDATEYTRRRPLEGLVAAFFVGILVSILLGRRR